LVERLVEKLVEKLELSLADLSVGKLVEALVGILAVLLVEY
jgi:hypothetical protein